MQPVRRAIAAVAGLAVILVVALLGVALWQWWTNRPIDYASRHGDRCLEPGEDDQYFRCWDLLVPSSIDVNDDVAVPLVVDLHGFTGDPGLQRELSGFAELADKDEFIVAWPYGIDDSWNGGGDEWSTNTRIPEVPGAGCCGVALNDGIDDVAFIRALIEDIRTLYPIDADAIFVTGLSNGCFMAQRVAAEASDLIAGMACIAGLTLTEVPENYEPVPILVVHGTADDIVSYESDFWHGAQENIAKWAQRNGCVGPTATVWDEGPHRMDQTSGCDNGADVALLTLSDVGHIAYGGRNLEASPTALAWKFLLSQVP